MSCSLLLRLPPPAHVSRTTSLRTPWANRQNAAVGPATAKLEQHDLNPAAARRRVRRRAGVGGGRRARVPSHLEPKAAGASPGGGGDDAASFTAEPPATSAAGAATAIQPHATAPSSSSASAAADVGGGRLGRRRRLDPRRGRSSFVLLVKDRGGTARGARGLGVVERRDGERVVAARRRGRRRGVGDEAPATPTARCAAAQSRCA